MVHCSLPSSFWYLPLSQATQSDCEVPTTSLFLPALHGRHVAAEIYKERPPQSPREIERNRQRRKRGRHSNTTPTAKPFILVEKPPVVSATTQSRRKSAASPFCW